MASMRKRQGVLVVNFRYINIHCRENANLTYTLTNRKKLAKVIEKKDGSRNSTWCF